MKEQPSVWIVVSYNDGIQCVFYYEPEARAWVDNLSEEGWAMPWEHFYVDGPFVVR